MDSQLGLYMYIHDSISQYATVPLPRPAFFTSIYEQEYGI